MSSGSCNCYANCFGYRKNKIDRVSVRGKFASYGKVALVWIWGVIQNSWWQLGLGSDESRGTLPSFPLLLLPLLTERVGMKHRGNHKKVLKPKCVLVVSDTQEAEAGDPLRPRVWDQPGEHSETPFGSKKRQWIPKVVTGWTYSETKC